MAELGKLLTFMYEEDRITAISMYEKMFDEAQDEEALLNSLISPTRQAVMIARSYDSKDRKLSVHSTEGLEAAGVAGEEPAQFITCISDIFAEVMDSQPVVTVLKDQISMFGEEGVPKQVEDAPAEEPKLHEFDVDAFIKDFSITNNELEGKNEASKEADEEPEIKPESVKEPEPEPAAETKPEPEPVKEQVKDTPAVQDNKKLSGGGLALFLLIAIPLCALGIIAILLMALAFLGLAAGTLFLGWQALKAAFASFTVFADVLVILGVALIIIALGVLFFWTFMWLLIGCTKGLVNGVINLATKICSKEEKVK